VGTIGNFRPETLDLRPRPLRAVLFDWDGTLVDSAEVSFRCYAQVFGAYGIAFDRARFAATYSPDWYQTYEAVALPREHWSAADARWVELYGEERAELLPGAGDGLARLRAAGLATALVTSGSRPRIDRELAALGAAGLFECVVCCEDVSSRKPDPAPLLLALERIGVEPAAAAYVGDSPEDILMARAAGAFALGIEGGFPNREALRASKPDLLAVDLASAIDGLLVEQMPKRSRGE